MYYKLTFRSSTVSDHRATAVLCGFDPLTIGEQASCNVCLPESPEHEPQTYATILPFEDEKGWYIVRSTDCRGIRVNGKELAVAQPLYDGDELTFTDASRQSVLRFNIYNDGQYDRARGISFEHRDHSSRYMIAAIALLAVAVAAGFYFLAGSNKPAHTLVGIDKDLDACIYHISTDSVILLHDTIVDGQLQQTVVEAIMMEQCTYGTGFLTDDGLIVTARHCVEPWIRDEAYTDGSNLGTLAPEVRLAAMAETANIESGSNDYTVRARCIISRGIERYIAYSTDFCMNKSRDQMLRLGSDDNAFYLRNIFPIAQRRDMELGDFAYLVCDSTIGNIGRGNITMATLNDLHRYADQRDKQIAVLGFPLTDNDVSSMDFITGNGQAPEFSADSTSLIGCLRMSASINPGNSGGPVFAYIGDSLRAVGIVSKADGHATQGIFWAVPTSEVYYLRSRGNVIQEDTLIFRR